MSRSRWGFGIDYFVADEIITVPRGAEDELTYPAGSCHARIRVNDSQRPVPLLSPGSVCIADDAVLLANFNQL